MLNGVWHFGQSLQNIKYVLGYVIKADADTDHFLRNENLRNLFVGGD